MSLREEIPIALGMKRTKRVKTQARTLEILDAAQQLFCEKGFERTGISEIAAAVGVAEGTIYKHFDGKKDLLYAILIRYYLDLTEKLSSDISIMDDPKYKLKYIVKFQIKNMLDNPGLTNLFLKDVRSQADYFTSPVLDVTRRYTNILVHVVEDGVNTGAFRPAFPPRLTRYIVYGTIEHLALRFLNASGQIHLEQITEDVSQALLEGLNANRGADAQEPSTGALSRLEAAIARLEKLQVTRQIEDKKRPRGPSRQK